MFSEASHMGCYGCHRNPNHFRLPYLCLDCIHHILYPGHCTLFSRTSNYLGSPAPCPDLSPTFCQVRAWLCLGPQHPPRPSARLPRAPLACSSWPGGLWARCLSLALRAWSLLSCPPRTIRFYRFPSVLLAGLPTTSHFPKDFGIRTPGFLPTPLAVTPGKEGREEGKSECFSQCLLCAWHCSSSGWGDPVPSAGSSGPALGGLCLSAWEQ